MLCPRTRTTATVHVELWDANGLVSTDEFAVSFHLHFHKLLKWLVALPVVCMAVLLRHGPAIAVLSNATYELFNTRLRACSCVQPQRRGAIMLFECH